MDLFKLLTLVTAFLSHSILFAQGADCANAESITVNGACDLNTTISQNDAAPAVSCGTASKEGWYVFTITGTQDITITGISDENNLAIALYSGTCASLTELDCENTDNTNNSAQTETLVYSSLAAGTYFVRILNVGVNNGGGDNGTGNMAMSSMCITSPAVNSATIASSQTVCEGTAVTLTSSYTVTSGSPAVAYQWYSNTVNSNSGGTPIGGATSSTYSPSTTTAGTYYFYCCIYTPGINTSSNGPMSNVVTVTVNAAPTTADAGTDFTTGACVTTATLAGNTPSTGSGTWTIVSGPGSVTTPSSPSSGVTGLQAGVATTFRWTISNSPCTDSFDEVTITGGACVNNDNCVDAISVTCGGTYTGSTAGMTTESGLPACSNASAAGVWYVVSGTGADITASLCGSAYDTRINVYTGADCASLTNCIAQNDDFCGLQSEVTFTSALGTDYYILVNGFSSNTGNYSLSIDCCIPSAPSCASGPSPTDNATGFLSCNSLSWNAPVSGGCDGATSYDVYLGTSNPPAFYTNTTATTISPALTGSTTYYWQVVPKNVSGDASGCAVWSFTTAAAAVPGCASGPSPSDGSTGVFTCGTLNWTAPASSGCDAATEYDVYLGTSNPPAFYINTTATSTSPTLMGGTTYYWQVIPKNAEGGAAGCNVWSFTTSGNNQYNVVDDALSSAPYECVTLTQNLTAQSGCAWDQNSTLNFASDFTYEWTINLGSNDAGADGMAFVIQNDPGGTCTCGVSGNQLGAGGISNSLIVEIDTYLNWEDRDDGLPGVDTDCTVNSGSDHDHLDIWLGGTVNPNLDGTNCSATAAERVIPSAIPLMSGGSTYNIENGLDHKMRVEWDASTSTITVSILDDALSTTYATVSYTFDPFTVFGTNSPYFGFTGSTGGLTNQQTFCNPAELLPVEVLNSNINCQNERAELNWTTVSEYNNMQFEIERSLDGNSFQLVGTVLGAGNANVEINYSWVDDERIDGVRYYRITQIDFDGARTPVAELTTDCSESDLMIESVSQNNGVWNVSISNNKEEEIQFELLDYSGRLVYRSESLLGSGNSVYSIDKILTKGVYILRVSNTTGKSDTYRIIQF